MIGPRGGSTGNSAMDAAFTLLAAAAEPEVFAAKLQQMADAERAAKLAQSEADERLAKANAAEGAARQAEAGAEAAASKLEQAVATADELKARAADLDGQAQALKEREFALQSAEGDLQMRTDAFAKVLAAHEKRSADLMASQAAANTLIAQYQDKLNKLKAITG